MLAIGKCFTKMHHQKMQHNSNKTPKLVQIMSIYYEIVIQLEFHSFIQPYRKQIASLMFHY